MTHVPYKRAGPALNDLLGEQVDFFFSGFPAAVAQVKAGKLKLLAVSTAKRSPAAPNVPTVGFPNQASSDSNGSASVGSATHLGCVLFNSAVGDFPHVPCRIE